jgi:hypothetical protein
MDALSRAALRRRARAAARFPAARFPVTALAALLGAAVVTALVLPSPAPPSSAGGVLTASGSVAITLTSAGTGGAGGGQPSGYPRVAGNGRYVAFQSDSALPVTASVPQTPVPRATTSPTTPPPESPPPVTSAETEPAAGPPGTDESSRRKASLPAETSPGTGVSRVYVRNEAGQTTTLASDAEAGDAAVPDISANGKLVSYELGGGGADNVYVTDRQATATGALDTPANLQVRPVTGTSRDLSEERIPVCPPVPAAAGTAGTRTVPCGPRLSADGTTLVYPARQSPVSPALRATRTAENGQPLNSLVSLAGNLLDFTPPGSRYQYGLSVQDTALETVTYTVAGALPVTFGSPPVTITGPFTLRGTTCTGTLDPGGSCQVTVSFSGLSCLSGSVLETGGVATHATTPAGQSMLELEAYCGYDYTDTYRAEQGPGAGGAPVSLLARTSRGQLPPPACVAPSGGVLSSVPFSQAPAASGDNQGNPLASLGDVSLGQPRVVWATVTNPYTDNVGAFDFSGSGCGIQLIDPGKRAVAGQPAPCANSEGIGRVNESANPASCTAYFFIDPSAVGIGTASAVFGLPFLSPSPVTEYVAVNGVRSLVIARHDPTGKGNFAASPSTVVSVDGTGGQIPAAAQPSVSSTGRYVAFTTPVPASLSGARPGGGTEVWLHDTDANGDRTYKPGSTSVASCLPGSGACRHAVTADSPSLSGDGQALAFAAGNQIEVRDMRTGRTVVASAGPTGAPGNGTSFAPALSSDASTVAFVSEATNLTGGSRSPAGAPSLYVRQLLPGSGGNELIGPAATTGRGAGGSGLPAIDAHGRLVAFQTKSRLVASAAPAVVNVYTAERFPNLEATPTAIAFGSLLLPGTPPGALKARTVTVRIVNAGPGPATVTGMGVSGSFTLGGQTCVGDVLHAGTGCTATVAFAPLRAGNFTGGLDVTTGDDGEPAVRFPVTATATVTTPALTLSPPVDVPGQVTQVQGTGFPAAAAITLTWNPGLGTATVMPDSAGRFTVAMPIFPDDVTGPRQLVAEADGRMLAATPFLVDPPPVEPPFTRPPGAPPVAVPSGSSPSSQAPSAPSSAPSSSGSPSALPSGGSQPSPTP